MIQKFLKISAGTAIPLALLYLFGPKVKIPTLDPIITDLEVDIDDIEQYINEKEAKVEGIKIDNACQIIWANEDHKQTEYSFVYLHGFSASHGEGDPVHRNLAKRYGANLYLPRLAQHGIDNDDAYLDLTVEDLLESAKEAINIGKIIGKKVILLTCSTGSTMSLFLAAHNTGIEGIVCYSPNVDLYSSSSEMMIYPWGLQLTMASFRSKYRVTESDGLRERYWQCTYRVEGLVKLKALLKATMKKEIFEKITLPIFMGYYYKNEEEQDKLVSVAKMLTMFEQLGTPEDKKRKVAFPDANNHIIASKYQSDDIEGVERETRRFLEEVLHLKAI